MLIRMKKTRGGVVLTCIRDQGSVAVQRNGHGGFFALHDLMHYAVESVLGLNRAFFGLVSEGWDFETFSDKEDPRYQSLPEEEIFAEHLVACLTRRYSERAWEDTELLALFTDEVNREVSGALRPFAATPSKIAQIYTLFGNLAARWTAVPIGEHMELTFPPAGSPNTDLNGGREPGAIG